ncbi:MAG: tyrosine-type recombinase/integrase [Bacillota bacterium]|nr:tyrosine-type recombinase/integrase [Bacillota bacterium]
MEDFVEYLKKEKRMAENSLNAYRRDVVEFRGFEIMRGILSPVEVTSTEVVAYINNLKSSGKSTSTLSRKIATIRAFFNYMIGKKLMDENPTNGIKSPRIEKKKLVYLSMEEIDMLLAAPDETIKGQRDIAILEVLYATGIKASELIALNIEDVNLRMGFITCNAGTTKARIIPLGMPARKALENYVYNVRTMVIDSQSEEKSLFINYYGNRITRQGLWKIIKVYGDKIGLKQKLTPNVIRNSFAVHMLQNGADLKSLQDLMGHEDIAATHMYLAATKIHIKDVYDRTHPRAR